MKHQRSITIGLLFAATIPGGCLRIEAARPDRGIRTTLVPAESVGHSTHVGQTVEAGNLPWPARWSSDESMGVIVPMEGPLSRWDGVRLGPEHYLRGSPEDIADVEAVARGAGARSGYRFVLEGPGSFIFVRLGEKDRGRFTTSAPDEMFKFVSGEVVGEFQDQPLVSIRRTWMAYYNSSLDSPRGLIVLVPGLFGVPEPVNDRFVEMCIDDGWAVLRLLAPPSDFTARKTFEIDPEKLDDLAGVIALELGNRAAEVAYAVDAGTGHVLAGRPELDDKPKVLIGMSGGAIALSTVHARSPEIWDAAVFIAGGANFLLTNEYSNYASWVQALNFDWGDDRPSADRREALIEDLSKRYLERAPLDAVHLAPLLADKPVLVLQGSTDKAVPPRFGDLLWEKLGQPERWMYPVGHEILFITLNAQTGRVLKWIDETLEPKQVSEP